jgi:hypothetical protein
MSSNPYVYYAQSRAHPGDPFYAKAYTRRYELEAAIRGFEEDYIVFRYSPWGACKVISILVEGQPS